jgi:hypothetical protein
VPRLAHHQRRRGHARARDAGEMDAHRPLFSTSRLR